MLPVWKRSDLSLTLRERACPRGGGWSVRAGLTNQIQPRCWKPAVESRNARTPPPVGIWPENHSTENSQEPEMVSVAPTGVVCQVISQALLRGLCNPAQGVGPPRGRRAALLPWGAVRKGHQKRLQQPAALPSRYQGRGLHPPASRPQHGQRCQLAIQLRQQRHQRRAERDGQDFQVPVHGERVNPTVSPTRGSQ